MAQNEYVIKQRLDTSDLEKGVMTSTAGMEQIADGAKRASEAMRAMFDTPAMETAKESFAGVASAVERYQQAMSKPLPMKRELRETQMAAQELEQAYRGLSDAERSSAAGQELRAKIDTLISRAGQLKDTMTDVQQSIKFEASDTAKLDAIVGGIKTLAATAQAAVGAVKLLGASEEDAMQVQKNLMAVMSVVNGLTTIQNALQKESALMMGVSAARTAMLTAALKVKAAVTKADTIASKAAAVAQLAWNAAIAANPIGAAIVAIGALAAAVYAYANRTTEAEREARALSEEIKSQSSTIAQNRVTLEALQHQWQALTDDNQRKQWIIENKEEFKKLGVEVNNVADAENLLVTNTQVFIQAMDLRARAAAYAAMAQKRYQEAIENRTEADSRANAPSTGDKLKGIFGVGTDWDFAGSIQREANKSAQELRSAAQRAEWEAEEYLNKQRELMQKAADLQKSAGIRSASNGSTAKTSKTSTAKANKQNAKAVEEAVVGSIEWYNKEIKKLEELADKTSDVAERNLLLKRAQQMTTQRDIKFEGIKFTIDKSEFADRFKKDADEALAKVKLKPLKIPIIPSAEDLAVEKSNAILEKTEGLRNAATAAASAFRSMGSAIGDSAGAALNVTAMLAQAIVTMIQGYASATAAAGKLSPWAWLAFGLTGLTQLMGMISAVKSAGSFASGGIVNGTSYTGDRQWARVNSGEMILNGKQQATLFNAINSGRIGAGDVVFRISGRDLVGVINNHNAKYDKVR